MTLDEALRLAQRKGLDLIEIAPNATPPVCRIVDYGKFLYEEAKRGKDTKRPSVRQPDEGAADLSRHRPSRPGD